MGNIYIFFNVLINFFPKHIFVRNIVSVGSLFTIVDFDEIAFYRFCIIFLYTLEKIGENRKCTSLKYQIDYILYREMGMRITIGALHLTEKYV